MGRYLNIAKRAEARLKAEDNWPSQGEQKPWTEKVGAITAKPVYRTRYRQMAGDIPEDMPVVDAWLIDNHPGLWRKIRDLDTELSCLERQGASEEVYRQKLEDFVSLCQAAKGFREGIWGGLLIKCEVLGGEEVWVVQNEEEAQAVMGKGKAIYYRDEIELLKGKTPDQIRDIHKVKTIFSGSRVMQ